MEILHTITRFGTLFAKATHMKNVDKVFLAAILGSLVLFYSVFAFIA